MTQRGFLYALLALTLIAGVVYRITRAKLSTIGRESLKGFSLLFAATANFSWTLCGKANNNETTVIGIVCLLLALKCSRSAWRFRKSSAVTPHISNEG